MRGRLRDACGVNVAAKRPITVVGAGVAGLTTALALVRRGARVTVLERAAALGADACSRLAGGMLAPWCEAESAEPLVTAWGQEALAYWRQICPSARQAGTLVLAAGRDAAELERFARRTREHAAIDAQGVAELEPSLKGRFGRGLFFPREGHLDPRIALRSLEVALREAGADLHFGASADPTALAGDVIDCRGLAARDREPDLRGVRGEMVVLRCPDVALSRPVRLLHPRFALYVVPRGDGVFMVGATQIDGASRAGASARGVVELLNGSYALHPAFADAEIMEIGADARPAFPDNLPRIRRRGRIVSVNGLYRHGFLLSPALAGRAAAAVLDGAFFPEVMDEDHGQRRSA